MPATHRRDPVLEQHWLGRWGANGLSVREFSGGTGERAVVTLLEAETASTATTSLRQSPSRPFPSRIVPVTALGEWKSSAAGPALTLAVDACCSTGQVLVVRPPHGSTRR